MTDKITAAPLQVLLAEDSEDDAFLFRHALQRGPFAARFAHVCDGEHAIAYLKGDPPYADRQSCPFPDMVFTDLKMPKVDGYHLLRWLQEHPEFRVLPTIVFTSSGLKADVETCYSLGAHAFLSKPNSVDELSALLQVTCAFWSRCRRPTPTASLARRQCEVDSSE